MRPPGPLDWPLDATPDGVLGSLVVLEATYEVRSELGISLETKASEGQNLTVWS